MMLKRISAALIGLVMAFSAVSGVFAERMDVDKTPDLSRPRKTSEKILFSLENGNDKFAMLDYGEDGFYIITTQGLGRMQFDTENIAKFDPSNSANIAYRLNNEYLQTGINGFKLPQDMIKHLVLRNWEVEAGVKNSTFPEDYSVSCKVALMSMTEWKKYQKDFGMYDDESWWGWYLRTSWAADLRSTEHDVLAVSGENTAGPIVINVPASTSCGVRPVFYLDRDFFKSVRLNMNATGAEVKKRLREVYTRDELLKIYSEAETNDIMTAEIPPEAKDVWAVGYRNVGDVMKGYYKYYQENGIKENGTTIRWVRSETPNGVYTEIPGTRGCFTYELQDADANKYVCFEVTPSTAKTVGKAYRSSVVSGGTVGAASKPIVKESNLFGTAAVGKTIGVHYIYYDANRELEEGTTFQWQRGENGAFENIPGANEKYYTVAPEDAGKDLRVCIVPQNRGRYRLAPPYNKGTLAVGDEYYSESVRAVAMPEAKNVRINHTTLSWSAGVSADDTLNLGLVKNNNQYIGGSMLGEYTYVHQTGIAEENSVYSWEISYDGGKTFLKTADTKEYTVRDGDAGRYIRFGVQVCNKEGTFGEMVYSEPVLIEAREVSGVGNVDFAEMTAQNKTSVTLSAKGLENAYAVSFDIEAGAKIKNVSGVDYDAYISGSNPVKCILTKKGSVAANKSDTDLVVIEFEAAYSGDIKISNFKTAGIEAADKTAYYEKLPNGLSLR